MSCEATRAEQYTLSVVSVNYPKMVQTSAQSQPAFCRSLNAESKRKHVERDASPGSPLGLPPGKQRDADPQLKLKIVAPPESALVDIGFRFRVKKLAARLTFDVWPC